MRNLRVLIIALAVLSTALFSMPAKALPSQGGCDRDCLAFGGPYPFSACLVGGSSLSNCTAIIYCADRDEKGRGIDCTGQCQGGRCLWV